MLEKSLRIIQANLNRSPQATETTLERGIREKADLILIQEPWIIVEDEQEGYSDARSISHPNYRQILPDNLRQRPRVLLYVSSSLAYEVNLIQTNDSDLLSASVIDGRETIQVVNLYNEKNEEGIRTIERALYSLPLLPNTILLGDFNIRHPS